MDLSRVLDRREQPLTGAELLAEKDQVRSGRKVLEVVDDHRFLGRIPGVEVLQDDEWSLPEKGEGDAGRDEGFRAYGRGVISLDRPSGTQLLDGAGLPLFIISQEQVNRHRRILNASSAREYHDLRYRSVGAVGLLGPLRFFL